MQKRGISPLIATVLLIGFTIVLATILINYVGKTTEKEQTRTERILKCQDVELSILDVCYIADETNVFNRHLKIKIENKKPSELLKGFEIRVEEEGKDPSILPTLPNTVLESYGISTAYVTYDMESTETPKINKITLIPKVEDKDGVVSVCPNAVVPYNVNNKIC